LSENEGIPTSSSIQGSSRSHVAGLTPPDLFEGDSSLEILHRLYEGDPLGLEDRCTRRALGQALLIDPQRLLTSAMARVAVDARDYLGDPPLDTWIESCIDRAADSVIARDTEQECAGLPAHDSHDSHHLLLANRLGIERPLARRTAIVFHHLPLQVRRDFYGLVIQRKGVEEYATEAGASRESVLERFTYAVKMLSTLGEAGVGPPSADQEEARDE